MFAKFWPSLLNADLQAKATRVAEHRQGVQAICMMICACHAMSDPACLMWYPNHDLCVDLTMACSLITMSYVLT
eukprot:2954150-Rhodomonas_salina.1